MTPVVKPTQHGLGPHTGAGVPGTSACVNSIGRLIGRAVLPITFAGSVLLTMVAVIVMPTGGGKAVDVARLLSLPNSDCTKIPLKKVRKATLVMATTSGCGAAVLTVIVPLFAVSPVAVSVAVATNVSDVAGPNGT